VSNGVELSPLQLKQLVFTQVLIEAAAGIEKSEEFWAPGFDYLGVQINSEVEISVPLEQQEEQPKDYLVKVKLAIPNEDGKVAPYRLLLEAYGVFELAPDFAPDTRDDIVRVNGASMIIGAMREMVATVTARSAFGPLTLPTLRFQPKKIAPKKTASRKKKD
jgi:preprotein translocase subunit SecB